MIKWLESIINIFLPKYPLTAELKVQAETLIFVVLYSAFQIVVTMVGSIISSGGSLSDFGTQTLIVSIQVGFLLFIRFKGSIENSALAYHSMTLFFLILDAIVAAKSFLASGLPYIPATLVVGFFTMKSPWRRYSLVGLSVFASLFIFFAIRDLGLQQPYNLIPQDYANGLLNSMLSKSVLTTFCTIWYVKSKRLLEAQRTRDLEDRIASRRIAEVNELIASLFPDLNQPLKSLQSLTHELRQIKNPVESYVMAKVEDQLASINLTVQTVTWIYRAYRNEAVPEMDLRFVSGQLDLLMQRKASASPYNVLVEQPESASLVAGKIPSVFLLLMNLLDLVQEKSLKPIRFRIATEASAQHRQLTWRISVEGSDAGLVRSALRSLKLNDPFDVSSSATRIELINDLVIVSGTELSCGDGDSDELLVRGSFGVIG